jgi:hypothetical protein
MEKVAELHNWTIEMRRTIMLYTSWFEGDANVVVPSVPYMSKGFEMLLLC